VLRPSDRAPGLLLGEGVELPASAEVGGNVVVHEGTVVGEGVRIQDGAVLGKPPAPAP
jgi:UDP-2-acetamido-3-amino-2,3-dideoxy-glucuronate N-acetyltransferase